MLGHVSTLRRCPSLSGRRMASVQWMLRRTRAAACAATLALTALGAGCSENDEQPGSPPPSADEVRTSLDSAAALPEARTEVAGARWLGALVVVGGLRTDGSPTARVDIYDPKSDTWRSGPDLPAPLHHTGLAVLGDRLWVAGGYS